MEVCCGARPSAVHYRDAAITAVPLPSKWRCFDHTMSAGTFQRFFASLSIICLIPAIP